LASGLQAAACEGEADGGILALDTRGEGRELARRRAQAAHRGRLEAVMKVVEVLATAADESL
jgi:hypothetical protein